MALDFINIPNTVGATLRENINDALDAVSTTFSGTMQPTTGNTGLASVIGVLWFDTTVGVNALKVNIGTDVAPNFVLVDAANAATATKLAATKNFSITGDITAPDVAFDGSGNVALSATIDVDTVDISELNAANHSTDRVLTATSTGMVWADAAGGGGVVAVQSGSFTFIKTAGVDAVNVIAVGGGGGAGGGASFNGGGAGGGGGYITGTVDISGMATGTEVTVTQGNWWRWWWC